MFCTRRATASALFVLLTAEVFHHCLAQDDVPLPPIGTDQIPGGGLGSVLGIPGAFNNYNPATMLGQLTSISVAENIPKYTEPIVQVTKTMIDSFNQIREAMEILEAALEE